MKLTGRTSEPADSIEERARFFGNITGNRSIGRRKDGGASVCVGAADADDRAAGSGNPSFPMGMRLIGRWNTGNGEVSVEPAVPVTVAKAEEDDAVGVAPVMLSIGVNDIGSSGILLLGIRRPVSLLGTTMGAAKEYLPSMTVAPTTTQDME